MIRAICVLVTLASAMGFAPFASIASRSHVTGYRSASYGKLSMTLGVDEKVIVIGVAADSGCGKSTFMRRLTKVFGGKNVGPLGGGFGTPGGWETNTLVSDVTTVICLDDYHLNDRGGRKVSGLTALNIKEQRFDLMYEHIKSLKEGKSIQKPIYNHVNGTLDTPETVVPTQIVIIEGLHPLVDSRVRSLLDFTIYLDISGKCQLIKSLGQNMQTPIFCMRSAQ
jgi:phosphoribulokinase